MNAQSSSQPGCVPNIGPEEQRKRLRVAQFAFAVALAALVALLAVGAPPLWRLALFLPLAGGAISYFQVRDKTCVALAAAGTQNLDGHMERMEGPRQLAQVRRQAVWVYLKGLALGLALTLAAWALPLG